MSKDKLKIHRTEKGNLVSNLRAEVGEIIETWILYRNMVIQQNEIQTGDLEADMENQQLAVLKTLSRKLSDEMIARLSELAEDKIGQLTFYFAAMKLDALHSEVKKFKKFLNSNQFQKKRNWDISHKRLPEKWADHRAPIDIPYRVILKGVAMALRLMKKFDRILLGASAPYCWRKMRKKRYELQMPAKVAYMLLPHLNLSGKERAEIIAQEAQDGENVWSIVETKVDGKSARVRVCKKWAAVDFGNGRIMMLPQYPLQQLSSINTKGEF